MQLHPWLPADFNNSTSKKYPAVGDSNLTTHRWERITALPANLFVCLMCVCVFFFMDSA